MSKGAAGHKKDSLLTASSVERNGVEAMMRTVDWHALKSRFHVMTAPLRAPDFRLRHHARLFQQTAKCWLDFSKSLLSSRTRTLAWKPPQEVFSPEIWNTATMILAFVNGKQTQNAFELESDNLYWITPWYVHPPHIGDSPSQSISSHLEAFLKPHEMKLDGMAPPSPSLLLIFSF